MIDRDETIKIAHLARLELTSDEVDRFARELSQIVTYVEQINELDLSDVPPTNHVMGLTNRFRPDQVRPGLDIDQALANAPERTSRAVKVPLVIGGEE